MSTTDLVRVQQIIASKWEDSSIYRVNTADLARVILAVLATDAGRAAIRAGVDARLRDIAAAVLKRRRDATGQKFTAYEAIIGVLADVLDAAPDALLPAWRDVLGERQRQMSVECWTPGHDDEHRRGELALAAAAYCVHGLDGPVSGPDLWPWAYEWWKPKGRRSNLVRATALLLAEIERLDRAEIARRGGA